MSNKSGKIYVQNCRKRELLKCIRAIQKTTNEQDASNYKSDRP